MHTIEFKRSKHEQTCKRLCFVYPLRSCTEPTAKMTPELMFRLFQDVQFGDTLIADIEPYTSTIESANEIWLSAVKNPSLNENESADHELIDYFQTSRLLYSNDLISVECENVTQTTTCYFRVNLKESPLWVDSSAKIFQSPPVTCRYPRKKIHQEFIPIGIRKIVENARQVLNELFKSDDKNASMVVGLLAGSVGFGKELCLEFLADQLCSNRLEFDCHDLWSVDGKSMEGNLNAFFQQVNDLQPCICELKNLHVLNGNPAADLESGVKILGTLSNAIRSFRGRSALFITANKSDLGTLPQTITNLAHFEFICDDLNEKDRLAFSEFVQKKHQTSFSSKWLADSIRGLVYSELKQLHAEAVVHSKDAPLLQKEDFEWALNQRNEAFGKSIGVPQIPTVTWQDVGGLEDVKQLISESLRANLNPKRLPNMRRSGVVLWGAPGCGKTLIAKAVANEFKMTFLSVKGPELLNQYIGQSEHNLRQVFEKARLASPSIIFFDELDSLAPSRGVAGDSSGVMDRMVSQLLSELDDLQTKKDCAVFVMGATNRPDLLDKCLLSPGRFDKLIEVKLATDFESKVRILEPICRKVNLADDMSVEDIAKQCPNEMSGAELSSLISNAAMHAIRSVITNIELGKTPSDKIRIEKEHIKQALESVLIAKKA
ncbi:Peroxisome assembly factor 2 [Aphelenchoides bicaudatus]|nr:Peroxisome assembly factor 2 [Aphelenchoides bicaudatus]